MVELALAVIIAAYLAGIALLVGWAWRKMRRRKSAKDPDTEIGRDLAARHRDLPHCDPRSPNFIYWAHAEYTAMFGAPFTAAQIHQKDVTILGWAYLGLDWLVNPPPTERPQLNPGEAAWLRNQLELALQRTAARTQRPAI